jgi:hypothetical protein
MSESGSQFPPQTMTSRPKRPSLRPLASASETVSRTAKTCVLGEGEMDTLWMLSPIAVCSFSESGVSSGTRSSHSWMPLRLASALPSDLGGTHALIRVGT